MLNADATAEIALVRQYFESVGYAWANQRFFAADSQPFPPFSEVQRRLKAASRFHRLLLSLFRQGHVASEAACRSSLPPQILQALLHSGLLVPAAAGGLRTPDVAIVPVPFQGLLLVTELPEHYPTRKQRASACRRVQDFSGLAGATRAEVQGRAVLDASGGNGWASLALAAQGAARLVFLAGSQREAEIARCNAVINDLTRVVEVKRALASAKFGDGGFDVVLLREALVEALVCGDETIMVPCTGDVAGLVESLLETTILTYLGCDAVGDDHAIFANRTLAQRLRARQAGATAFVARKWTLDEFAEGELLPRLQELFGPSAQQRADALDAWVTRARQGGATCVYRQLVRTGDGAAKVGLLQVPFYDAQRFDPRIVEIKRSVRREHQPELKEERACE